MFCFIWPRLGVFGILQVIVALQKNHVQEQLFVFGFQDKHGSLLVPDLGLDSGLERQFMIKVTNKTLFIKLLALSSATKMV